MASGRRSLSRPTTKQFFSVIFLLTILEVGTKAKQTFDINLDIIYSSKHVGIESKLPISIGFPCSSASSSNATCHVSIQQRLPAFCKFVFCDDESTHTTRSANATSHKPKEMRSVQFNVRIRTGTGEAHCVSYNL